MKQKGIMKKTTAVACAAACTAALLGGCAKPSQPGMAPGKTDSSDAPVEISFTVWDYETTNYWKALVEAFELANPDIKVKVIDIGSTDYETKVPVLLSSGDTSDVIAIKNLATYASLVDKKQLMPLDDMVKANGLDISPYRGLDEGIKVGGQLYGLPFRNDYYLLYYNKTLFDRAGLEYPSNDMTWDEYRELAKKLTTGQGNDKIYGSYLHTWSGSLFRWGIDKNQSMYSGNYQFLKPVYELFLGIQNDDKTAMDYGTLKTGNIHYSGPFYKEQVAMEPMGTWFANLIINTKQKGETSVNWGAVKAPRFEHQDPTVAVSTPTPIAINKNAAHPVEAWRFIEFMCTEPGANILANLGILSGYQTEKTINTLANVDGMPDGFEEAIAVDSFVLEYQMVPQLSAINKVTSEEHDLIMLGAVSIDDGIANMEKRVQEILNK